MYPHKMQVVCFYLYKTLLEILIERQPIVFIGMLSPHPFRLSCYADRHNNLILTVHPLKFLHSTILALLLTFIELIDSGII